MSKNIKLKAYSASLITISLCTLFIKDTQAMWGEEREGRGARVCTLDDLNRHQERKNLSQQLMTKKVHEKVTFTDDSDITEKGSSITGGLRGTYIAPLLSGGAGVNFEYHGPEKTINKKINLTYVRKQTKTHNNVPTGHIEDENDYPDEDNHRRYNHRRLSDQGHKLGGSFTGRSRLLDEDRDIQQAILASKKEAKYKEKRDLQEAIAQSGRDIQRANRFQKNSKEKEF